MTWLYFLLFGVAIIINVTMDEIQFHWGRWFGKIIKLGSLLDTWMRPTISWQNKYKIENKIAVWLLSTGFVWITDFWHFLKFIFLNCFIVGFLLANHEEHFWVTLIAANVIWGVLYESFKSIYGLLSDYTK